MSKRRAFTLIELFVTIAIVAVLAGILLPSLDSVRDMAKFGVCQANLKGIGAALYLYAQDNDQWIPAAGQWWPRQIDGENVNWNRHLSIYDESAFVDDNTGFSGEHFNPAMSYIDSRSLFYCSEDRTRPDPNEWPYVVETSYGLNFLMTRYARYAGTSFASTDYLYYSTQTTKHPSEMYFVCDTEGQPHVTWGGRVVCTCYQYTPLRHVDRCNMLFHDGHIQSMANGEIRAERHNIAGQAGHLWWYDSCPGPDNCAGNDNAGDGFIYVDGLEDLRLPWANGESY